MRFLFTRVDVNIAYARFPTLGPAAASEPMGCDNALTRSMFTRWTTTLHKISRRKLSSRLELRTLLSASDSTNHVIPIPDRAGLAEHAERQEALPLLPAFHHTRRATTIASHPRLHHTRRPATAITLR